MRRASPQLLLMASRTAAGLVALAAVASVLLAGCGDPGTTGTGSSGGGTATSQAMTERPPIDLLAPASFETASFAFG